MPVPMPPQGPMPSRPVEVDSVSDPLDPLDDVRQRLDALDAVPLERHPVEFDQIDRLLREALNDAGSAGAARDGVPAPPR